ncbi:cyclin-like F-box [Colletotrichum tofieldiae]|uniref:Cyclin-like F-box n=1 Tax=Colletotrichum tofieldiae TaxID=708197 RepID=A0A166RXF9_9PEZI|nr:cyclin-like F-box [Colletotrichum tofieldiae]
MSPNAPDTSTTPAEVAFADDTDPFVPKPLIDDLLRTRYCIPGSIFLVEDIESLPVPRSKRWRAVRLVLGDGELCIQALLRGEMHRFLDSGAVRVGCYVRLGEFAVRFQDVAGDGDHSGRPRQMVYLVVHDLVTVGWHRSLTVPAAAPQRAQEHAAEDDFISDSDLDVRDVEAAKSPPQTQHPRPSTPTKTTPKLQARKIPMVEDQDEEDDAEGFEVMQVSETKVTQRRAQAKTMTATVALPRDWTDPSIPLKLTALRSIPNLPYKQNWSVNVLAIVTSLSDVEPSHMPPHTQRTARLADPSTSKQVILTVFLDAEEFNPKIGSVVLLVGVKNHRFDGGCLKKYVSDKPKAGGRWWFEEPRQFDWCDVDGLKHWWEQSHQQGTAFHHA